MIMNFQEALHQKPVSSTAISKLFLVLKYGPYTSWSSNIHTRPYHLAANSKIQVNLSPKNENFIREIFWWNVWVIWQFFFLNSHNLITLLNEIHCSDILFGAYYKTGSLFFLEAKSPSGRTNLDGSLIFFVENPHQVGN